MIVLGISAFYHDSAAALIADGEILAAAQEERFSRVKHDERFPRNAVDYCLRESGISPAEIDAVVFYEKPFIKFERLIETYMAYAPKGLPSFMKAAPVWLKEKLFQKNVLIKNLKDLGFDQKTVSQKIYFSEHHLSHAASAFYCSPFDQAIVLTMDGVGEWTTTSVYIGEGQQLKSVKEMRFPHSLGLLYSAFTYFCGFKVNSGEYKLMGLAPYGEPRFKEKIMENLIDLKSDGSFRLNMEYFGYATGLRMTNNKFNQLFGCSPRKPEEPLSAIYKDIAASIQQVTEEIILRMTRSLFAEFQIPYLCLAGGVALNCVANGKILKDGKFRNIWIQPAAGDAGGSLGAALAFYHQQAPRKSVKDSMRGAFLGPEFSDEEIRQTLNREQAVYKELSPEELIETLARELAQGKAAGWFQGKMEFGPRALGSRSILADPRDPKMQSALNLKIKFRESFRPFAPAVLEEEARAWFDLPESVSSPYMLLTTDVHTARQGQIPAVTHVDQSARVQTVSREVHPKFHALLSKFHQQTGCPVLVNTSFNVRGEPVVCRPEEAFRCFMGTGLDLLAIGNFLLRKEEQRADLQKDYKDQFHLD